MRGEIRAMSMGEIFGAALKLVHDHFAVLVGIAAVICVPLALVGAAIGLTAGEAPSASVAVILGF